MFEDLNKRYEDEKQALLDLLRGKFISYYKAVID